MTQATDTDIRELKDLITGMRDEIRLEFLAANNRTNDLREELRIGITEVKGKIDTVNSRLSNLEASTQKIPDLAEKVGELKNWRQIVFILLTSSVGVAVGWVARGGKF